MRTRRDVEVQQATGLIPPDRLSALAYALAAQQADARTAAGKLAKDDPAAIALRGKATAYGEAKRMTEAILRGDMLRPRSYSSARQRVRPATTIVVNIVSSDDPERVASDIAARLDHLAV